MRVASLHIYPVKSFKGLDLAELKIREDGPEGDRIAMITDADGKFLTQRQLPKMATMKAHIHDGCLYLEMNGEKIQLSMGVESYGHQPVRIWSDEVEAQWMGKNADEFVTRHLGRSAKLVHTMESSPRIRQSPSKVEYKMHFADQAQVLLTSETSLKDLNSKLEKALPMNRFRANIVIAGIETAWVEETWKQIRIGEVEFEVMKNCSRCAIVTTDQETGVVGDAQVLKVLKSDVKGAQAKADFGVHLRVLKPGTIRAGDDLQVLQVKRGH